jgi:hypothetical protein
MTSLKDRIRRAIGVGQYLVDEARDALARDMANALIRELEAILESDEYRGLRDDPEFCAGMSAVLDLLKGKK